VRTLAPCMEESSVARIDAQLIAIQREHEVSIPLAIESGSRAWGFPSPDSDYNCRFIFARRTDDYLSLFAKPDVIELPLDGDLDVNGWELAKSIRLLLKGNAVVIEWLTSPIVYMAGDWFRDAYLAVARSVASRERIARHYLHLGERQRHAYFADDKEIKLKKLFYALRPAAALRWLRLHPNEAVAPMHFPTLMRQCDPPPDVNTFVAELTAKKAVTNELGSAPVPPLISGFIDSEFSLARDAFWEQPSPIDIGARVAADAFFRAAIAKYASSPAGMELQ
jgi:predicted nucleotidyltransferase